MAADEAHAVGLPPEGMEGLWFNTDAGTGEITRSQSRYTREKISSVPLVPTALSRSTGGKHRRNRKWTASAPP